jgi:hypothetical protein
MGSRYVELFATSRADAMAALGVPDFGGRGGGGYGGGGYGAPLPPPPFIVLS